MRARLAILGLLAVLPVSAFGQLPGGSDGALGSWNGELRPATGEPIELTIVLGRGVDGDWIGTAQAPALASEPVPLEAVAISAGKVRFSAIGLPGSPEFVGVLSDDSLAITGDVYRDPPPSPPATDIHLIELDIGESLWTLGPPINITDRDGYDNQPRFLPDASALLYTSIRDGQADVYRYDLAGGRPSQVTETDESEYSPTPLPTGDGFSTVRVEDDGTQRLWSFDFDGSAPMPMLREIEPVGYHAWLSDHLVALFVLGSPPTLEIADLELQTARVLAEGIGRSIYPTPDGAAISFVHKASEGDWRIERIERDGSARSVLISTRPGSEDFVWTTDGRIVMAEGSALYQFVPGADRSAWEQVADLAAQGVNGITRLDVSSDRRWLAVVGERLPTGPVDRTRTPFVLRKTSGAVTESSSSLGEEP